MLRHAELDMANAIEMSDIDAFLADTTLDICSTYDTILIAPSGVAIFGPDMLFNIHFLANLKKLETRQCETDLNTKHRNCSHSDWKYKVGDQVLL